jgi:rubrerythrin
MSKIMEILHQAYTGEAKAVLRLMVYADKAEKEGYPQMARLFRAIALSEEVHGTRALRLLKEIKSTEENLAASFESDTKVAGVAYDAFIKIANEEGNRGAAMHFSQSRDSRRSMQSVQGGHGPFHGRAGDDLLHLYNLWLRLRWASPGQMSVCSAKPEYFTQV